jgi:hypothetical protein
VSALAIDGTGNLYAGTTSSGVYALPVGTATWTGKGTGFPSYRVWALAVDAYGHLYAGTEYSVFMLPRYVTYAGYRGSPDFPGYVQVNQFGCTNPWYNGSWSTDITLNLALYTAALTGSGTLVGYGTMEFTGTRDASGNISGTFTAMLYWPGVGTFTGTMVGSTMTVHFDGHVTSGETCSFNGDMSATRSPVAPEAATPVSPSGVIETATPPYTWNAVATATVYYLWVNDATGFKIAHSVTAEAAGCPGGTGSCTVTPTIALTAGGARWYIQAWSAAGYGPWSRAKAFTVNVPPPAAILVAPTGTITTTTPVFIWEAVAASTYYRLIVEDSTGPKINTEYTAGEAACEGGTGTCSVTPGTALAPGGGQWQVQTKNSAGYGPLSTALTFTVTLPTYLLTLARAGSADGTVTSSPGGISCGGDCSESYAQGTSVTLTAIPAAGATFKEWRGACAGSSLTCNLAVTGITTVTAVFAKIFTDPTLVARTTLVKASHVSELRLAIDTLRSHWALGAFAWTDPTLTVRKTAVGAVHLTELRTALEQAYTAARRTPPTYTDPTLTARVSAIKAIHVNELRSAVRSLE